MAGKQPPPFTPESFDAVRAELEARGVVMTSAAADSILELDDTQFRRLFETVVDGMLP